MATTSRTLTHREWITLPETQDAIEEVVNGEVHLMPPNRAVHARVVQKLASLLDRQLDEATTQIFSSVFGLVIRRDPLTCRVPDLAVFRKATLVEEDGFIVSPPELAIEVLSPGNTRPDREEKLRDYESIGIPEVWLLSPEARSVEVLQLEDKRLVTTGISNQGILHPRHFPEVSIDIATVWPK
jgi:Uma2 family endonuclease